MYTSSYSRPSPAARADMHRSKPLNHMPRTMLAHLLRKLPMPFAARNAALPSLSGILLVLIWTLRLLSPSVDPHDQAEAAAAAAAAATAYDEHQIAAHRGSSNNNNIGLASFPLEPPPPPSYDLSDLDGPFISWPLQRVCRETTWVEGLVYVCDNNSGGLGNIRSYIQTCIRYAIAAGATGLTVPKIRARSETDLADLFTDFRPLSYLFDEGHFRAALGASCPQITLYDDEAAVPGVRLGADDGKPVLEYMRPKDIPGVNNEGPHGLAQDTHADQFGDNFRHWLLNVSAAERGAPSAAHPRLFRFEWGVLWDWPVWRDGPEMAATFGHILKPGARFLALGRRVEAAMRASAADSNGRFLGVHLRSESDALDFWPSFDAQADAYLARARAGGFTAAYLASGDEAAAARFRDRAARELGMAVRTKQELLGGASADLAALRALSWDQQALVDYAVLLRADYFMGVMPSSFSVLTTMRRHLKLEGIHTRPYPVGTDGDGRSFMTGRYDKYYDGWLMMFDGMWP